MNPLDNFDKDNNFWEFNKQLKVFDIPDKSKNKVDSSNIMWIIAFMCESDNNIYSNIPEDERLNFLCKEFNISKLKIKDEYIEKYLSIRTPYVYRKLRNWKLKLDERDKYIASVKYDEENADSLDKLLANTDKLYKQYFTLEKELNKDNMTKDKGSKQPSLSDEKDNF